MTVAHNRIMLTNDDGVEAAGLACLEDIAQELSEDLWVVAPAHEQSGASRKMSFADPIRVSKHAEQRFAVHGTPADATFLGLHDLIEGDKPDLVLSGVNRGQNLADDVSVSGTVAAAIQAMKMGVPAIALSQTLRSFTQMSKTPYATALEHGPGVIKRMLEVGWPTDVALNVNFPPCEPSDVKGLLVTQQGVRDQWHLTAERREDLRGRVYYWLGFEGGLSNTDPGDDLHAIYNNYISITPLHVDLTHRPTIEALQDALGPTAVAGEA